MARLGCIPSILIIAISYFCMVPQLQSASAEFASPLYAESRWIVNKAGKRVKLACVNWPSHMQPVLAEGLHKQPVDATILRIKLMGFNCVRFTWPVQLATNDTLASLTVEQSFQSLKLNNALAGIKANNPWIVDLTLMDAYKAMLSSFDRNHMMVILDNHVSMPGWCCGDADGNGFFGDTYFDPNLWKLGLNRMALIATKFPCVVGMSLRNELRGPKSNVDVWYKYMQEGAQIVHAANPNVLVILSGLKYDMDLSFIRERPIIVPLDRKLVFEMHWYSFANLDAWRLNNTNEVCGSVGTWMMNATGFLPEKGYPLFVTEFGVNERGTRLEDNKFLNCFMAYAAGQDWDFAVWSLQGSYYLRKGVVEMDEDYGLLDFQWSAARNSSLLRRLSVLQSPFTGPGKKHPMAHKIIFHPLTGLCIQRGLLEPLRLGPCQLAQAWTYTTQKALRFMDAPFFLQAVEPKRPATLLYNPLNGLGSTWEAVSASKLHLASKANNETTLCLDTDENGFVVTNYCKCITRDTCEPFSQWFKIIDSTRI